MNAIAAILAIGAGVMGGGFLKWGYPIKSSIGTIGYSIFPYKPFISVVPLREMDIIFLTPELVGIPDPFKFIPNII